MEAGGDFFLIVDAAGPGATAGFLQQRLELRIGREFGSRRAAREFRRGGGSIDIDNREGAGRGNEQGLYYLHGIARGI